MKRLHRSIVTSALTLCLGGGAVYYLQIHHRQLKPADELAGLEAQRLFDFGRIHVSSGTLYTKGSTLSFARDEKGLWWLTHPVRWPADQLKVNRAIDAVATIRAEEIITQDASRAELSMHGLRRASTRVTLKTDSGLKTLWVGPKNKMTNRYPITDENQKRIGISEPSFDWIFQTPPEAFRRNEAKGPVFHDLQAKGK